MKKNKFFCKRCRKYFDTPRVYDEKHNLDSPPYERVAVCPICFGDDFVRFDTSVEKIDIVERLLQSIMYLNRFIKDFEDVFGVQNKNSDLSTSAEIMIEAVSEMFDFLDNDVQIRLLKMCNERDLQRNLMNLKGEL